ncbi:hypothetical protein CHUAL_007220 [Chamberlinius hualienensis]
MDEVEEEILAEDDGDKGLNGMMNDKQEENSDSLVSFAWAGLILAVCLYFLWTKFLKSKYNEWKLQRELRSESAEHHKDPDRSLKHLQGLEAARQRMQEAYDTRVAQHAEKTKQQEEAKRAEKINNWEQHQKGLGYHNKSKPNEETIAASTTKPKTKNSLRPKDYNPLMGSGGSSGYRSSRKGPGAGGG